MFMREDNHLAFVDFDNKPHTYAELTSNIKRFSSIYDELNGENILILMENRPEWLYAFFSIWNNKGVGVAIDANSNPDEMAYVISDAVPKIIFCSDETKGNMEKALEKIDFLPDNVKIINVDNIKAEELKEKPGDFRVPGKDDTAAMLYTSGTTGNPKGVMLSFENLLSNMEGIIAREIITDRDQTLALLPFHHVLPLMVTLVVMHSGASIVFVSKIASKEMLEALGKNRVTIMVGVPRVYKLLADGIKAQIDSSFLPRQIYKSTKFLKSMKIRKTIFAKVHKKLGSNLKQLISGGAKLDVEVGELFERLGFYVTEGYGLTETSPIIAVATITERKLGTVGKLLPRTEVKIVEDEIWIKGPQVMKGYYNKPDKTKEIITEDGWLKTGDLGDLDSEGYLTVKGRKSSMIVLSNGKNIDPEAIETKIQAISKNLIKELGIVPKNEKLNAIVVPDLVEFKKQGKTNIQQYVKEIIEDYNLEAASYRKVLHFKLVEEELPKTRIGKLKRFMLPDILDDKVVKKEKVPEPDTNEYRVLRDYVKKIKGFEPGPDDNLELEIGLDSLDKVELLAYIENSFGLKLDEGKFSEISTLRKLSEYIKERATEFYEKEVDWSEIIEEVPVRKTKSGWIVKVFRLPILLILKAYFRLKRADKKKLTDEQVIFVSNHQSFIDALVVAGVFPARILKKTSFLAIDLYFKKGFMKYIAENANIVVIDINNNIKHTIEEITNALKQGKNILIFPEGARTKDGKVGQFKKVFAILAKELNISVQCIGIKGAFEAYSRYMKFPKPRKIEVKVLEKFSPEGTYEEIAAKAENIIREYVEN